MWRVTCANPSRTVPVSTRGCGAVVTHFVTHQPESGRDAGNQDTNETERPAGLDAPASGAACAASAWRSMVTSRVGGEGVGEQASTQGGRLVAHPWSDPRRLHTAPRLPSSRPWARVVCQGPRKVRASRGTRTGRRSSRGASIQRGRLPYPTREAGNCSTPGLIRESPLASGRCKVRATATFTRVGTD
jgi:hypothetical protein